MEPQTKKFVTTQKMMDWQYFQLLGELQEIQRHDSDVTCPCRLSEDLGENCLAKHTLGLSVLAAETAAMAPAGPGRTLLEDLSFEAKARHLSMKGFLCHTENEPEFTDWSRQWRKRIEPLYYHQSCKSGLHSPDPFSCQGGTCTLGDVPKDKEVAATMCRTGDGSIVAGNKTFGDQDRVDTPRGCPAGTEQVGLFHTHVHGGTGLSTGDRDEAKKAGITKMCVGDVEDGKIVCHQVEGQ